MPDDLAEQINWVHQACEALGVPIVTAAGLRGRRRDRHAGACGPSRPASRSRSSRSTRTSSSSCATASASTTRAKTAPGSTTQGVVEKFGVKPSQVVDVLALVGDTSDNVAGVPGIGKKGAIDLSRSTAASTRCSSSAGELKPKQREALSTHRDDALRSRELVTIRTDVPLDVDFESLRYRGASRERCYELFSRLAFRTLVNEYAPTADTIEKDYALVTSLRGARRARSPSCARPASSRCASSPTSRRRCAPASSASRSRRADRQARYRAARA